MSIELPEATILAEQMTSQLRGKQVTNYQLKDYKRLQRIGFLNKDLRAYDQLINETVTSVTSRGNAIRVQLSNEVNLLLNPEYGGQILLHTSGTPVPAKFHLFVNFKDDAALTVRLTSMGGIFVLKNADLPQSYIYRRDFNPAIMSPLEKTFTLKGFSQRITGLNRGLKSVLVGKNAVVVGLSNSAFQDIIYRAGLHPKRKAAELQANERQALYQAIMHVMHERIRLHGKTQFVDLYGNAGKYIPAMGPHMKQANCPHCSTRIKKLQVSGGSVYLCPNCQR